MSKELSPEQWQKIEGNVNEAEAYVRRQRKASEEVHLESGMTKAERESKGNEAVLESAKRKRVAKKALEREEDFEKAAEDILGGEGSPERELVKLKKKNLVAALRGEKKINDERKVLIAEEVDVLKPIGGEPSGAEQEALSEIRKELAALDRLREELLQSSPEAYIGLHLKELKEYKKELEAGGIVETPYVKRWAEDIAAHARAGKPIFIYGHLGSGKSEMARHVSHDYISKEPLIISGSKHTTIAEFFGHQILKVDEETGSTISEYFLGPIYRAMQEGRPAIIEEWNSIPHETRISLNDALTRKIGDKVNVQQNAGTIVEIQDGFCIIATGNLNQGEEKYIDRQDLDPAQMSRFYNVEYDYLPQKTDGSLEAEAGEDNELFHLMLARVVDKNVNLEAPKDSVLKLWNLAKAARVTEDVFAGREVANAFYFQQGGGRSVRYLLKESVLSIRAVDNVVTQWQGEGYKRELDYYLWMEFVSQSTVASDKAYLYQMLKDRFGFFTGNGWEQNPSYGSGGVITSFDVKPPENSPTEGQFFGPREVVAFAYGKAPERTTWPNIDVTGEIGEKTAEQINLAELRNLEAFKNELEKKLSQLEKEVGEFCESRVESERKTTAGMKNYQYF